MHYSDVSLFCQYLPGDVKLLNQLAVHLEVSAPTLSPNSPSLSLSLRLLSFQNGAFEARAFCSDVIKATSTLTFL